MRFTPGQECNTVMAVRPTLQTLRRAWHAPLLPVYVRAQAREPIQRDVVKALRLLRGSAPEHPELIDALDALAIREFRSVFYARLRGMGGVLAAISILLRRIYPGQVALAINCDDIGPGLVIMHGFATIIVAQSVGCDCMIAQQVTIGYGKVHLPPPIIGDRVCVLAGAMVLGDLEVGHDAVIGAGAVVITDVPPYAVMVGVPARVSHYMEPKQSGGSQTPVTAAPTST
jgi:serine acetyltransferase